MGNKQISNSFNHSNLDNVNIQSEIIEKYSIDKSDLEALEKEIRLHSKDEISKEQNMLFYDKFQESLINEDKKEANKYLNWIERGLNSTAALSTIITALGL
ncbi:hypothetical protein J18TS1_27150 [Oceanobacillus oncorhynchi subsp. incaldanensis]|uniref:Uncharacterized protein n=1 Tax=Oceanobacillus oncorhynchi TaxID=545501 RepID=A0A0A1M6K5_9BACI|nr:hypothetical protein [Oceanobacillus oncorhynchi]GIO19615.1 hypothetical protein J18TS1_27150 [Oceanobacillus oncorhynchi subsp. incaldanensis]CEI80910.1 hypothetical protein BN997_00723 [Oceanobacillus oncorhynchi]